MSKFKGFLAIVAAFCITVSAVFAMPTMAAPQEAGGTTDGVADELVIGKIIAMDGTNNVYEAMTVKNGMVQFVGSLVNAKMYCDDKTKVMDYGDNYIYPGFMDAHAHGIAAGPRLGFYADLSVGQSYDDYLNILKEYIEAHPDNANIYGAGWMERGGAPNAQMLDNICPDKPVALNSVDGHSIWMNTKAMEKFGINKSSVQKWGPSIIRVDADGNPTGYISEGPFLAISKQMMQFSPQEWENALLLWQDFAFSKGITAYYEAGGDEDVLKMIKSLIDQGKWKLRVYIGIMIDENEKDYVKCVRNAKKLADKYNCEYLQVTGVKIFMDGVLEAHTAWMLEDYIDQPGYRGVKRFCDHDRTVALYKEASRLGLSVHQHTIGDGAVQFALDCIEDATRETGNMDMRNALAHLQFVTERDKQRMAELNVIGVVAPLWSCKEYEVNEQSESYVGVERNDKSYPGKSLLDKGVTLAFHSDYPVSPQMSFPESMYIACMRKGSAQDNSRILGANEALSRQDALAGMTTGPAYSVRMENHLGKLQSGYVANFCVYDSDFLRDNLQKVAKSKLIATVIDGNEVFSRK